MFDPLHKWLGIPPDQQPPNLYRLLGISPFESDEDVINAAADKQLAFLHDLSNGTQAEAAEELSNQVSAARVTLLIGKKKAAYDAQLKEIFAKQQAGPFDSAAVGPPPPPIAADATAASGPPVGMRASEGWYIRHHDKRQHGPFGFDHLLEATRVGHVASDTEFRHPISTGDRWVVATSIPEVSRCWCVDVNALGNDAVPLVIPQPRRSVRHYSWQAVLRHLCSFILFLVVPIILIYQNPRLTQWVRGAIGNSGIPNNHDVVPTPIPAPDASIDNNGVTGQIEPDRAPTPIPSPKLRKAAPKKMKKQGPQRRAEIAKAPVVKLVQLKLGIDSTRWIKPLEETFESGKYFAASVTNSPTATQIIPSSGELSRHRATRVAFDGMSGLAIDLRLEDVGQPPVLSLTGQWVCQIEGDTDSDFSLARLRNRERYLVKQRDTTNMIQTLTIERKQRKLFLDSKGVKNLEAVKNARNRIKFIDTRLPLLKKRENAELEFKEQFLTFKQQVQQIHDRSELVVRNVDQP